MRCSTVCRTLLRKLQSVQNATARLITGTRRCDHIMPVLHELHWQPIRERVEFKLACLVHQSLSGQPPAYLADDCRLVSDSTRRSAVSGCPDVRITTNLQQLRRQNLCSCGTSVVELTPAAQSRHQLRTVQTTSEGSSLRER